MSGFPKFEVAERDATVSAKHDYWHIEGEEGISGSGYMPASVARLLGAAPDMYEALQLVSQHTCGKDPHYPYDVQTAIQRALAKAEGRS